MCLIGLLLLNLSDEYDYRKPLLNKTCPLDAIIQVGLQISRWQFVSCLDIHDEANFDP